jgi:hypothetical protein
VTYNPNHKQGDRRKHYQTWAAKPGNLEKKREYNKARYLAYKEAGVCVKCGQRDAREGYCLCERCGK